MRPESFVAADGESTSGLCARIDPATRESLGSETIVGARVGDIRVQVRLFDGFPVLPSVVVAPVESLHLFDAAGRRLDRQVARV